MTKSMPSRCFLGKENRLPRRAMFLDVYGNGKQFRRRGIQLFVLDKQDGMPARLGVTVPRKVGKACRRNRLKRLARECFRLELSRMRPGLWMVLNFNRSAVDYRLQDLERLLHSAWREAGVLEVPGTPGAGPVLE